MADVLATSPPAEGNSGPDLQVSVAREQLADLVNRVAYAGETVFLTRRGRRMAALVPVALVERADAPTD